MVTINREVVWVPKTLIADLAAERKRLTISSYFDREQKIPLYLETATALGYPRHWKGWWQKQWYLVENEYEDQTVLGDHISFKIKSSYRAGQEDFLNQFQRRLKSGVTGFLFDLPMGSGKTFVGLHAIQIIGRRALVVLSKSDLIRQWREEIAKHTDIPADKVGIAQVGKVDWKGKWIVLGLVHTFGKQRFSPALHKHFGTVIWDEPDRSVPPETFAPVACLFPARYRIAMGATLQRKDGMHRVIEAHMGECYLKSDIGERVASSVLAVNFKTPAPARISPKMPFYMRRTRLLELLTTDPARNAFILSLIKSYLVKPDRHCAIVVEHTALIYTLRALLIQQGIVKETEIGIYAASLSRLKEGRSKKGKLIHVRQSLRTIKAEEQDAAKDKRIILTTYGMFSYGTNIPVLAGLIMAHPRADITQLIGRIERVADNKPLPILTDIVDIAYPDAVKWGKARLKVYQQRGMKIGRLKEAK
jgi:superfamily II DNA or RNA helicase